MRSEVKDKSINIIIEDAIRLKELTKEYYDSEDEKETAELLDAISWTRNNLNARLDLLQESDIINIDEWTIMYRLITTLI